MIQKKLTLISLTLITILGVKAQTYDSGRSATKITIEVTIDAPITSVWSELENFGGTYRNSPPIDTSFITSSQKSGVGTTRRMIGSNGSILDERLVSWDPDQKFLAVDVYEMEKIPGVMTMGGNMKLTPLGNQTIITSTLSYDMKSRFWGMMNGMMVRNQFVKNWKKVLLGYKKHIETGELVHSKTKLDLTLAKVLNIEKNLNKSN